MERGDCTVLRSDREITDFVRQLREAAAAETSADPRGGEARLA